MISMGPVVSPSSLVLYDAHSHALFVPSYLYPWGSLFEPLIPISGFILINHRDWSECAEIPTKGLCMFKSQQYRAKATEYGELVKSSTSTEESRKFQDLEDRFVSMANNERDLADACHDAAHIDEQDRTRGAALAAEEGHVLRCLGAAVI